MMDSSFKMFKLCKEEWNFHCIICYRRCILRMLPWPLTEWEEDSWEGWAEFFEWEICSSLSSAILMQQSLLLLLLSHFSRVRLCATPSLGFSRQEHCSGLPFPSPVHKSEKWKWSHSVVSDSSPPHGLQPARLLRPWDVPGKSTGVGCHCLLRQQSLATTKFLIN